MFRRKKWFIRLIESIYEKWGVAGMAVLVAVFGALMVGLMYLATADVDSTVEEATISEEVADDESGDTANP